MRQVITLVIVLLTCYLTIGDVNILPISCASVGGYKAYSTRFLLTENPISEGGKWINGQVGLEWDNVRTTTNFAFGTQNGSGGYDDSTALLTGPWGPNQTAEATVRIVSPDDGAGNEEVELRLRSSISSHSLTGYEIQYSTQSNNPYFYIVRWDGALGRFTNLIHITSGCAIGRCYVHDGDVVTATVDSSNTIRMYVNGTQVLLTTDNTFTTGAPGMGFYLKGNSTSNSHFGFANFTATDAPVRAAHTNAPRLCINSTCRASEQRSSPFGDNNLITRMCDGGWGVKDVLAR